MTATYAPRIDTQVHVGSAHMRRLKAACAKDWEPDQSDELETDAVADLVGWGFLTARFNPTKAGRQALVDRNWK